MELAPNPTQDGAYLYRFNRGDFPRVVNYRGGRWLEASGPNRGRPLDRPGFWCRIPQIEHWVHACTTSAA